MTNAGPNELSDECDRGRISSAQNESLAAASAEVPSLTDLKSASPIESTLAALPAITQHQQVEIPKLLLALVIVLSGAAMLAVHIQSYFDDPKFANVLLTTGMREHFKAMLPAGLPLLRLLRETAIGSLLCWVGGAAAFAIVSWTSWQSMLWRWGVRFLWVGLLGLFELLWASTGLLSRDDSEACMAALLACLPFFHMVTWGGLFAGALGLLVPSDTWPRVAAALSHPWLTWVAAILFAVTFSVLAILQYQALLVPHGDTAMYEEHLWNLLHGKGFRSQLDSGRLFFGEHLEVIHLLLLPVYVLYPYLPTLNVCLSIGLASGAIAVRGITQRLTYSPGAANALAIAYLLYFPLQYLNLEVSLKTFRPENLAVPLLLFAIWCLEAGRWRTMLSLMGLVLLAKEDYALPIGMMGLYLAARRSRAGANRNTRLLGLGVFAFSVAYLWFVLDVFIPHFRGGPPHYTAYYPPELGGSPSEIIKNSLISPALLADYLGTGPNLIYVLTLVIPIAGLPLLGMGRLWVLLPTLASILLIQLKDAHSPFFHFHAPLVPILFWSAAEGLGRMRNAQRGTRDEATGRDLNSLSAPRSAFRAPSSAQFGRFAAMCALVSGALLGKSPLSITFFDPNMETRGFGRVLYVPIGAGRERMTSFERLFAQIPANASVAATDFVRPRFTHHRECHQYGAGGLKPHVPLDSIDYIVIDLLGPYSDWFQGRRLREVEEHPDEWEFVRWDPNGIGELFFRVARAKRGLKDSTTDEKQSSNGGPVSTEPEEGRP